jgi:hypothetical protein
MAEPGDSAEIAFAITPNDSTDLVTYTRAIHANTDGVVRAIFVGGVSAAPDMTVKAGMEYPWKLKRVMVGTSATIVGLT